MSKTTKDLAINGQCMCSMGCWGTSHPLLSKNVSHRSMLLLPPVSVSMPRSFGVKVHPWLFGWMPLFPSKLAQIQRIAEPGGVIRVPESPQVPTAIGADWGNRSHSQYLRFLVVCSEFDFSFSGMFSEDGMTRISIFTGSVREDESTEC